MPYAYETLGTALSDLGRRLYDPTFQFWTAAELTLRIQQALQTWNALTGFWRDTQSFSLSANNSNYWYDLTAVSGSIRPMNTNDTALIQSIEYHLLEPVTNGTYPISWTGSNQYVLQDVLDAIQQRRDDLLGVTGCTLTRTLVPSTNNTSTVQADSVIDIRRVAWLPTTANANYPNTPLRQSDDRELQDFNSGWQSSNATIPSTWRISAQVPLTFSTDVAPAVSGNYETLTVNGGAALSNSSATVLPVPNDWCWVLEFGALSDLFSKEGLAKDDLRAQYCEKRYQEGLGLLFDAPALLSASFNNTVLPIAAVRDGDDYNSGWQNSAFGVSTDIYTAGLNLIAFSPPANSNAAITSQVVENAPLPANNNDNIQLAKDDLAAVLDYAQHLAALKMGGAEFMATVPLYQGFLKRASLYNSKLQALGTMTLPMYEQSQLNQAREATYVPGQTPRDMGDK